MTERPGEENPHAVRSQRWRLLRQLNALTEQPLTLLAFVWLGLLIIDLTSGLTRPLEIVSYVIWALFGLDFAIGMLIAPHRRTYLRHNWLTALALALPALRGLQIFRAFRVLRAARAVRSVSLLRLLTSLNRSMGALRRLLGRRGLGFALALTLLVLFGGAAGMAALESPAALRQAGLDEAGGLTSYSEAVWWTAMTLSTFGTYYWPQTGEGRLLGWLLSVYAVAVFGYITAAIASYFVGQERAETPSAGDTRLAAEAASLRREIADLRGQMAGLLARLENGGQPQT